MNYTVPSLQLSVKKELNKSIYDFLLVQVTNSPDGKFTKQYTSKVQKEFIERDKNGYIYSIQILDQKQKNTEDIGEFEETLDFLRKKIILSTNANGEIQSILNRSIIKENWEDKVPEIKKMFKNSIPNIDTFLQGIGMILDSPDDFLNFIKKSEIYNLLFPPVFDLDLLQSISVSQNKILHNFFEHCAIPLALETKIHAYNTLTNGYQISRKGKLDAYNFDEDAAAKFIFDSYGIHKSNLKFDAVFLECYDLDNKNNIDKANGIFSLEIPDIFSYRQISKLIQKS